MLEEYQKIRNLYNFNEKTHKYDKASFALPAFEYLKDLPWLAAEKYDGINIRVYWDGYNLNYYGRTRISEVPKPVQEILNKHFENGEDIFEKYFVNEDGSLKEVILFMEAYGGKIQKAQGRGWYNGKDTDVIGFDVAIDGRYVDRRRVKSIFDYFGIETVEFKEYSSLQEIIDLVENHIQHPDEPYLEGYVATPLVPLYGSNENRSRIAVKIKTKVLKKTN